MTTQDHIVKRYKKNPILTKDDVPYPVATVHNAGIVKHNGRYIMLFRSHLLNGRSIIGRADSEDGFSFTVHPQPFLTPSSDGIFAEYEAFGVEDLRICPVEGEYLLTYSAYSRHGVRIALARTEDFEKVERIALITQPTFATSLFSLKGSVAGMRVLTGPIPKFHPGLSGFPILPTWFTGGIHG